jgi:hypothetical protein
MSRLREVVILLLLLYVTQRTDTRVKMVENKVFAK